MTILKIIIILLGITFTIFGYLIYFRKQYNLINDFEEDCNAGRKTKSYAKRVGLTEFIIGIAMVLIEIFLIIFK